MEIEVVLSSIFHDREKSRVPSGDGGQEGVQLGLGHGEGRVW